MHAKELFLLKVSGTYCFAWVNHIKGILIISVFANFHSKEQIKIYSHTYQLQSIK